MVQIINSRTARLFQVPPPMPKPKPVAGGGTTAALASMRVENVRLQKQVDTVEKRCAALEKMLADLLERPQLEIPAGSGLSLIELMEVVSDANGVIAGLLRGPRRSREVALPRQMYCWLARIVCPQASLPAIGRMLKRDHTSVMHAITATTLRLDQGHPIVCDLLRLCLERLPPGQQALVAKVRKHG